MAKELTPLGQFVKWVLAPALIGVIGYRFIGPNVAGIGARVPAVRSIGKELRDKVKPGTDPEEEAGKPASRAGATQPETPAPAEGGASEFARVREEQRARRNAAQSGARRAPIDRVDQN